MARSGCRGINFGLESGSDDVLGKVAKQGVDVRRIRTVLAAARAAGLHSHLLVAVGLPEETRETLAETYELLGEVPARSLGVTGITPFPGTQLWEDAEKGAWILTTDWSRYGGDDTVMRTSHLQADDIRFAAQMLFERFQLTHSANRPDSTRLASHRARFLRWVGGASPKTAGAEDTPS
jgi:radical SAM superfamily enzyme YgiQ (UPF0313 family)